MMEWKIVLLAAHCLVAGAFAQNLAPIVDTDGTLIVPDKLIVRMRPGAPEDVLALRDENGEATARVEAASPAVARLGFRTVRVDPARRAAALLELASSPDVQFAGRVSVVRVGLVPNDPALAQQYHHRSIGTPAAWEITRSAHQIPVAVIDSGVDASHPELRGNVLTGWNVADGNSDTRDLVGHGTFVAGVIGAAGNNGTGGAGVTWGCPIIPFRVSDARGDITLDAVLEAMVHAVDRGAKVLNLSIGPLQGQPGIRSVASYARSHGALVVAAAGNTRTRNPYPDEDELLFVAATTAANVRAGFSTFGPSVDLAAPGESIFSTWPGGRYAIRSGTSAAAPMVAGAAALAWSTSPWLAPEQVEAILKSTARDRGAAGRDELYGHGLLDVAAAVRLAHRTPPLVDVIAPAVEVASPSAGTTVTGTLTVNVRATDDTRVGRVELLVDGLPYAESRIAPFTFRWNTAALAEGPHTLTARAFDLIGNVGTSPALEVAVRATAVGRWECDEGRGQYVVDSSGNRAHAYRGALATPDAADPVWVAGVERGGLAFNTRTYVTVPALAKLRGFASTTIEASLYRNPVQSPGWKVVLRNAATAGLLYGMWVSHDGALLIAYRDRANRTWQAATAAGAVPVNTWTHVSGALGPSGLAIYVNGQPVAAAPGGDLLATGSGGAFRMGRLFNGRLDRVAVYNRALSAGEALAHAR